MNKYRAISADSCSNTLDVENQNTFRDDSKGIRTEVLQTDPAG